MFNARIEAELLQQRLGMTASQIAKVTAVTLTELAFRSKKKIEEQIPRIFDRPTPWIRNSVFAKSAKVRGQSIEPAVVGIKGSPGSVISGSGISPSHSLWSEVKGGARSKKGWESSLSDEAPSGRPMLRPGARASLDAYGNISTGQIKQIISAFQASRTEGFSANSRIRGVSGLTRSQADRIQAAQRHDEFLRSRRMGDANNASQSILSIQARQRLNDFRNRLGSDESLFGQARSRVKTWMIAPGRGKTMRAVIYSFRWTYKWSQRLGRNVYKKTNIKPVAAFTRSQRYRPRLDIGRIAQGVFSSQIRQVWEDTAMRLFRRWGNP